MRHCKFLTPVFIHVDNKLPFHAASWKPTAALQVSVAAGLEMSGGAIQSAGLALGGVAPNPLRLFDHWF
ncbi:MAG: hypothetical protein ABSG91_13585 [Syntrophobacteraceae bacterium]|jgi:CO/xanthine dehydrogenase FAD-binding subunit